MSRKKASGHKSVVKIACGKVGELRKILHDSELERRVLEEKYKEMELLGTCHNILPSSSHQLKRARLNAGSLFISSTPTTFRSEQH